MSDQIGAYSFFPWLRAGLAARLEPPPAGRLRATVPVTLRLEGDPREGPAPTQEVHKDVPVYGPGDIVGIDRRAIVRTEPRQRVTTFEPNYLPFVEFYDEDFPWRYSPEVPAGHRLRPWLALVVLKESEFTELPPLAGGPLAAIRVEGAAGLFQPFDQLWAWAHVQANRDLAAAADEIVSTDAPAFQARLEALLAQDPDLATSRLLCPRRLDAGSTYHAFIIPAYESGRLAGLGRDPAAAPVATHGAWQDYPARAEGDAFPTYYRWRFQTGTIGDFEYLVRLLEPRPVDSRVGRRDIDVLAPGSNLGGIADVELHGALRLGGALRVPRINLSPEELAENDKYENWDQPDYPHDFQTDLAAFVNLADDYQQNSVDGVHAATRFDATMPDPANPDRRIPDPDPLIVPPLYGRWHSLTPRLLNAHDGSAMLPNDNWVHQLNLDPRHRTAAGFGTAVIQQNQEEYMNAAWEQVGAVLEANKRIRRAQFAKLVATRWHERTLRPLAMTAALPDRGLTLTLPVQRRVLIGGVTARFAVEQSKVPRALLSTAARRVLRPRARLAKSLPFSATVTPGNLVSRVNAGDEVKANPPKPVPAGLPQIEDLADGLKHTGVPPWVAQWLARWPQLPRWLFVAAIVLLLGLLFGLDVLFALVAIAAAALGAVLRRWQRALAPAASLAEARQTPAAVDAMPSSADFRLIEPGDAFRPTIGGGDNATATRYKTALRENYALQAAVRTSATPVERLPLNLRALATTVFAAIDPRTALPRHTFAGVAVPARIKAQLGERFAEVMAHPEIDLPMYKPLAEKSADAFVPNLDLISPNTISLLETNQPFIEAYMVGLNHEFARELLWREYPTDQRGSPFRQFWDVSGYLAGAAADPAVLREQLKDIAPLHRWPRASKLGQHDQREQEGREQAEVVLLIRGELLKKYPTAVIYAHRARWQIKTDGSIDNTKERQLEDPGAADNPNPPRSIVKTPLYEAKVDPDIYFFGFDLTAEVARGDSGEQAGDDPGWFFVIKERPGEPRFGLDVETADHVRVWNSLGWGNVVADASPGAYIEIGPTTPTIQLEPLLPSENEQQAQASDDDALRWHPDMDAAELAYILYQVPVLVAVHAAEMLPKPTA